MPKLRGILTVVCFILLSAVVVAAAVQAISIGLPESLASNATVLIQALASEDVSREPRPAKLKLGQRVQRELSGDVDWASELGALSDVERERLANNVVELAKESFEVQVDIYFKASDRERRKLLERQVDDLMHWATVLERANQPDGEPMLGAAAVRSLFGRVGGWYRDAKPEQLDRLKEYQQALIDQMTKRFKRRISGMGQ
jgi:hypothetical protein